MTGGISILYLVFIVSFRSKIIDMSFLVYFCTECMRSLTFRWQTEKDYCAQFQRSNTYSSFAIWKEKGGIFATCSWLIWYATKNFNMKDHVLLVNLIALQTLCVVDDNPIWLHRLTLTCLLVSLGSLLTWVLWKSTKIWLYWKTRLILKFRYKITWYSFASKNDSPITMFLNKLRWTHENYWRLCVSLCLFLSTDYWKWFTLSH